MPQSVSWIQNKVTQNRPRFPLWSLVVISNHSPSKPSITYSHSATGTQLSIHCPNIWTLLEQPKCLNSTVLVKIWMTSLNPTTLSILQPATYNKPDVLSWWRAWRLCKWRAEFGMRNAIHLIAHSSHMHWLRYAPTGNLSSWNAHTIGPALSSASIMNAQRCWKTQKRSSELPHPDSLRCWLGTTALYRMATTTQGPELEKKHVKRFTDLLLQNLPRCRKISIYVHSHDSAPKSDHFEGHPCPSNEYTLSMIGKGSSVTHSWCDEIAPRWRWGLFHGFGLILWYFFFLAKCITLRDLQKIYVAISKLREGIPKLYCRSGMMDIQRSVNSPETKGFMRCLWMPPVDFLMFWASLL